MSVQPDTFTLAQRYQAGAGPVLLTGVQAIGRLLVEQHAADAAAHRRTISFVSGYQGSPLGGLDKTLAGAAELVGAAGLTLVPAVNEELAATAVWGSQVEVPGKTRSVDGAVGVWYGKAPGVDRAGDAMRHGNICGADPRGGVLVLAGDDPACKSSTIPCVSERALAGFGLPVFYPRDASDIVRLGRYAVAASRASGMWIGMKIVADVADGVWTLDGSTADLDITVPELEWDGRPWTYTQTPMLLPPASVAAEEQLYGPRRAMLRAFLEANPVNVVELDIADAWLGVVAAGKAFADARQALADLGLDTDDALRAAGIRLLRLGAVHPVQRDLLRRFATGLDTVLVVEEKTEFVESAVRDALYRLAGAPEVIGSADADGRPLVPVFGEVTAAALAGPMRRVLAARPGLELVPERPPRATLELLPVARTPYFCSGCPHNRSTVVPDGLDSVNAGGIGCHAMVAMIGRPGSEVSSLTQMGGEGAQWIGQSALLASDVSGTRPHCFQNIGDGTFAHSGQLAVQACVAAGVSITFKLLYNRAVAMTGGQDAEGGLEVSELTRKLTAEGVARIIVCADEPERYKALPALAPGAELWHRDRLDEAQRLLAGLDGVTVLIYDQRCAAESRRLRKRGEIPVRATRVVINEAVCEGCGDCGAKSNCLSVQPVQTEFGRKTRIDQTSCNTDYSCLDGDCPSFVTVQAPAGRAVARSRPEPPAVPDPGTPPLVGTVDVFLAGIGGTGIVTVNQVLGSAAVHDGLAVHGVDQTGLSQKAGPVTSHLRLASSPDQLAPANRVGAGRAGCYLAFDALVGAEARNLAFAGPATSAVVSAASVPTGSMVRDAGVVAPATDALVARIAATCGSVVTVDAAAAAGALFGDTMPATFLLVGVAYQAGVLPLSAEAVEWAIELNGVAVAANTAAFRWGRVAVADPGGFDREVAAGAGLDRAGLDRAGLDGAGLDRAGSGGEPALPDLPAGVDLGELAGETRRLAHIRAAQLVAYQGPRTARRYLDVVSAAWRAERSLGEASGYSEAVARGLHRLTAYKDEYEVARLLTDPAFEAALAAEVPGGTGLRYRLHPPLLRALGRDRKIAFGPWLRPVLRGLARGKRLRGTPLDPFGHTALRRLERDLRDGYTGLVARLTAELTERNYDTAVAAAEAADLVRGYEEVKLAGVERYRARLAELGIELD
jgi:indolepyruvate ferredoxin oxidoreductase